MLFGETIRLVQVLVQSVPQPELLAWAPAREAPEPLRPTPARPASAQPASAQATEVRPASVRQLPASAWPVRPAWSKQVAPPAAEKQPVLPVLMQTTLVQTMLVQRKKPVQPELPPAQP